MTEEYVRAKRWEGKSLSFKCKYLWANYPEIGVLGFCMAVVFPVMTAWKLYKYPESMNKAMRKYKYKYRVVRDDDPRLPEIIAQKELGKHYFPN